MPDSSRIRHLFYSSCRSYNSKLTPRLKLKSTNLFCQCYKSTIFCVGYINFICKFGFYVVALRKTKVLAMKRRKNRISKSSVGCRKGASLCCRVYTPRGFVEDGTVYVCDKRGSVRQERQRAPSDQRRRGRCHASIPLLSVLRTFRRERRRDSCGQQHQIISSFWRQGASLLHESVIPRLPGPPLRLLATPVLNG